MIFGSLIGGFWLGHSLAMLMSEYDEMEGGLELWVLNFEYVSIVTVKWLIRAAWSKFYC